MSRADRRRERQRRRLESFGDQDYVEHGMRSFEWTRWETLALLCWVVAVLGGAAVYSVTDSAGLAQACFFLFGLIGVVFGLRNKLYKITGR